MSSNFNAGDLVRGKGMQRASLGPTLGEATPMKIASEESRSCVAVACEILEEVS